MLKSIVRKCYRIKESADFSLHALEHLFDFSALLPRNAFTPLPLCVFSGNTRQRQTLYPRGSYMEFLFVEIVEYVLIEEYQG